jgi:hypothetical protein
VGAYADRFVVAVKPHDEAGGAAAEDLALLAQPGRYCPVAFVHRDLFDPTVLGDKGAMGVAPRVIALGWHSQCLSCRDWMVAGQPPSLGDDT